MANRSEHLREESLSVFGPSALPSLSQRRIKETREGTIRMDSSSKKVDRAQRRQEADDVFQQQELPWMQFERAVGKILTGCDTPEDREYVAKKLPYYEKKLAAIKPAGVSFLIFDGTHPVSSEVRSEKMSREEFVSTLPLIPQED